MVATAPVDRVVATGGWVVTTPPEDGIVAGVVVVVDSTVDEVELDEGLDGGRVATVVVGRAVVAGDWVATCCLGDVSPPVATSKRRAAKAKKAST